MRLNQLLLWQEFVKKADNEKIVMVKKLVEQASNLLDLIRDTFPTYTLHNHVHAENVLYLMGKLLEKLIEHITALEGAILILSAYYHDIGMVFTEEERNNLLKEESFESFKNNFPGVAIRVHKNNSDIPLDIAEHYCRWCHPDRVALFLNRIDDEKIKWGSVPLKKILSHVCQSHGYDVNRLHDDEIYRTDFLGGNADLKFCAIILRIADILDFDHSRTPDEIYSFLDIEKGKTKRTQKSTSEWRKHLCSDGFVFPEERNGPYELSIIACPDHPAVEYDVRQCIEMIEIEFNKCTAILSKCSKRWQNFFLPYKINRKDLHSNGYKYIGLRFKIKPQKGLDLLIGENLYGDQYVFIRELLQNAIDTCRHRQFYEESHGNTNYKCKIAVSSWYGHDGYQWLRIDDNGMGMDEYKITHFFLKVGQSYYHSSEFELEKLKYKQIGKDFMPISRFGIGMLSCFMAGGRLEINTKPLAGDNAFRLSLAGLHRFPILRVQKDCNTPDEMPSQHQGKRDYNPEFYRTSTGTSIAIRIEPEKMGVITDFKELVERYVKYSPIPVEFEGENLGGNAEVLEKPWLDGIVETQFSKTEMNELGEYLKQIIWKPIKIKLIPIDLTKHSPTPNLKGQLVIMAFRDPAKDKFAKKLLKRNIKIGFGHPSVEGVPSIFCFNYGGTMWRTNPPSALAPLQDKFKMLSREVPWISHNGITVPQVFYLKEKELGSEHTVTLNNHIFEKKQFSYIDSIRYGWLIGNISLEDSLRPDVSLSRDRLIALHWNIYSTVILAFSRALAIYPDDCVPLRNLDIFSHLPGSDKFLLGTILKDPYIGTNGDGQWSFEPIIDTNWGKMSLRQLKDRLGKKGSRKFQIKNHLFIHEILHPSPWFSGFTRCCVSALVQMGLSIKLTMGIYGKVRYIVDNLDKPQWDKNLCLFPPLFFVPYEESNLLRINNYSLNRNHSFSRWLLENAGLIHERYPALFHILIDTISSRLPDDRKITDTWWKDTTKRINEILDQLKQIDATICPGKSLYLKEDDFQATIFYFDMNKYHKGERD